MKKITMLFLIGFIFSINNSFGQISSYNFQSLSSAFTTVTGGTVLGNTSNDEQVFNNNTTGETAPQTDTGFAIGFNFFYNGSYYDNFAVNNNGWILIGTGSFTIGATIAPLSNSGTTGFANCISALGRDLQGQSGSQLSYKLIGTSPNRTLVVQWLNYRRYNISSGESFNFQIRLNETDNSISFVYGNVTTTNTSTTSTGNPTQVGLRGATSTNFKNRTTISNWAASTAGTVNSSTMRLTTTVKPASGLEFKWTRENMSYSSSTTLNDDTTAVKKNSINNEILCIQIVMNGLTSPLSTTAFAFTTAGSTNVSNISNARVWFTGISSDFAATQQFGSTTVNPNGSFTVTGSQVLQSGTNYFWLTYSVPGSAVSGDQLDGECNSITISGTRIPTIRSPFGSRTITNAPLKGTYSIGLQLYNLVLGKELYYKRTARTVLREFSKDPSKISGNEQKGNETEFSRADEREFREVTEDAYMLMEGNEKYTGPACLILTPEIKQKFSSNPMITTATGVYANITDAFVDISANGLNGAVEFSLIDEIYSNETFPITISELVGSSALNTVTVKPAPGITPQIVMSTGSSVIKIYNTKYITIDGSNSVGGATRDLSITSNDAGISYGVWFGSSTGRSITDLTLKNCIIKTGEISQSCPVVVADGNNIFDAGYFDNVTISNNVIQKGNGGIFINGGTSSSGITNLVISGNFLISTGSDALAFIGIYASGIDGGVISMNEVGNLQSTYDENDRGIWVANNSRNLKVEKNRVFNIGYSGSNGYGGYGIYLTPDILDADDTVCNNIIYNIFGTGYYYLHPSSYLNNPVGIALFSQNPQSGITLVNNSINLYGNTLLSAVSASFGIFVSTNSTLSILNNVISNNLGSGSVYPYGSFGIYVQSSVTQLNTIDYNNYSINPTGSGLKVIGKISTINASTSLDNWRTVTLQDKSSISYLPGFTSNTDLSPDVNSSNTWSLNGRGKQILSVTNDFNGNPRSTTLSNGAPDIGAYEFTPLSNPPLLTSVRAITNGSVTDYVFGSDTVATITWHGANLPTALTLKYFSGTNPPSVTLSNYGNSYWEFIPTGGSGYTFDISLYWDPALIGTISGKSSITMANFTAGTWEHYNAVVDIFARTVTHTGLTKLSTFTIDDNTAPLPVTLLYFNHSVEGRNALLKWATSSEINNKGFEIERNSESSPQWKKIGFVQGIGTTYEENNYEYKDAGMGTGKYHYRLKQIDFSGNFEYFSLLSEVVIGKPLNFNIGQNYPNPSNPKAKIDYQVPFDSKLSIKVFNIQGQEVVTLFEGFSVAGYYSTEFDGSSLASGIYFYRIVSEHYVKTMKMILVK